MRQFTSEHIFFRSTAKVQAAFTVAVTDIITSADHGLQNGDMVQVSNSGGALPAGLSATPVYYVIEATTGTFKLSTVKDGVLAVDITDTGSGTQTWKLRAQPMLIADYLQLNISFYTGSSSNSTVKFAVSDQEDVNFNAAQSATNRYSYVELVDLEDEGKKVGDTGVVTTGTDILVNYEANINSKKLIVPIVTAWSAGSLDIRAVGSYK